LNIKLKLNRKFKALNDPARYKVLYGGRGGGKSWAVAYTLLILGLQNKLRILCTRELQRSIADSVHRVLNDIIQREGLHNLYQVMKANIVGVNGTEFLFSGLRSNISEIKSMEGIDICWVEEAQKVSEESWQILIPTIRKEGSEIWLTFNPDGVNDPTYRRFVLNHPPDSLVEKINYSDNPWFPETLRKEMEWDKQNDYNKYMHVWEGEPRTLTDAQVFKDKFVVEEYESLLNVVKYYGADWGFAQDPSALVRSYVHEGCLYIDYEAYGVGVDIDDTPALFSSVPGAKENIIVADSARPETISYMNKNGWNVRSSSKGKGSVMDGISFLRSFKKIIIHERCKNTINEFYSYSYKVDRLTGDILPILVDAHNHSIDALRYGLERLSKGYGSVNKIAGW